MSSKTLLLNPFVSDACLLSASSAVAGASGANLQNSNPASVWQSLTSTPYILLQALTGQLLADTLVLGYFSMSGQERVRVRAGFNAALVLSAPSVDTGWVTAYPDFNASARSYLRPHQLVSFTRNQDWVWRVDFDWASYAPGYVRGARLMLGLALVPVDSAAPGWEMIHNEQVIEQENIGGSLATRPRGARRSLNVAWQPGGLTVAEGAAVQELLLERGSARDFAVCVDTSEQVYRMSTMCIGRVKQQVSIKHVPVSYRTTGFTVEELGVTEMAR